MYHNCYSIQTLQLDFAIFACIEFNVDTTNETHAASYSNRVKSYLQHTSKAVIALNSLLISLLIFPDVSFRLSRDKYNKVHKLGIYILKIVSFGNALLEKYKLHIHKTKALLSAFSFMNFAIF